MESREGTQPQRAILLITVLGYVMECPLLPTVDIEIEFFLRIMNVLVNCKCCYLYTLRSNSMNLIVGQKLVRMNVPKGFLDKSSYLKT
jgi:hypothetical protein